MRFKVDSSSWALLGCAVAALGYGSWLLFQPPQQPIAHATTRSAIESSLFDEAAKVEADRLKSEAFKDPECQVAADPIDCFLSRLERENGERIAQAVFRMKALEVARGQGK